MNVQPGDIARIVPIRELKLVSVDKGCTCFPGLAWKCTFLQDTSDFRAGACECIHDNALKKWGGEGTDEMELIAGKAPQRPAWVERELAHEREQAGK